MGAEARAAVVASAARLLRAHCGQGAVGSGPCLLASLVGLPAEEDAAGASVHLVALGRGEGEGSGFSMGVVLDRRLVAGLVAILHAHCARGGASQDAAALAGLILGGGDGGDAPSPLFGAAGSGRIDWWEAWRREAHLEVSCSVGEGWATGGPSRAVAAPASPQHCH